MEEKRPAPSKVFDVAKPGRTAALPTSKEILTANPTSRPPRQELAAPGRPDDEAANEPQNNDGGDDAPYHSAPAISKFSSDEPEKTNEPETAAEPDDVPKTGNEPAHPDGVDELKKAEIDAREKAAHDKKIQELVASRKYYLPINQVEKRRNTRTALIGVAVVVLLALVWVDVALDAGLVSVPGVKAPTHFFK